MTYLVSVAARSLVPAREWRSLVPEARPFATLKAARSWVAMMRSTWTDPDVLLATEDGVVAFVVDERIAPVMTIECGRDHDTPAIERDRDELHEMQKTTTRRTTR